ncbi:MAG: NfeD family protein [Myxococcales bacterium]|nr:NfeD family protein [Myxococcales bacterium]
MVWWQWVVLGAFLLGAEAVVDTGFYLVFLGAAALCLGGLGLLPLDLSVGTQWLVFAALSAALLVLFRRRMYERVRGDVPDLGEGVHPGEEGVTRGPIAPGAIGTVELRGAEWRARNADPTPIGAGVRVRVEAMEGLVLLVHAVD